jgi:chitodextrinase
VLGKTLPRYVLLLLVAVLPPAVYAQSNTRGDEVELTGTVAHLHGDDFRQKREADEGVFLDSGGTLYRLPESAHANVGQRVTARGEMRNGRFLLTDLAAAGGSSLTSGSAAASAGASGSKRVAVILFNFSDDASQPFTPASVGQTYFATGSSDRSVVNYYNEVGWGRLQLSGQTFGWYTIPATTQTCDPGTWANQADAAAQAAGVNLSSFDYKAYVYPGVSLCGWGGLAEMPGTRNWINGSPDVGVMAHELGHNLGLSHASSATCTLDNGDKVAYGPNCSKNEYGDQFDVMGGSARHINDWHRAILGFTSDVQKVSADGTYTLAPVENETGSPHALRIARGDGTYFDLEYRQPYGIFDAFSPSSPAVNGVMIRKVGSASTAKTVLLDTTPQTPSFDDAPLAAGQTFVDPTTGIMVKTLSVSSTGAQVDIRLRAGDSTPPNVTISTPADGASVGLPTAVTVTATDNVAVAKVELYRQRVGYEAVPGTLYGTDTSPPYTFSSVDGVAAKYAFTAVAYDTSGVSSVSPVVTVDATQADSTPPTVPTDTQPPTIPTNVLAEANGPTAIQVSWQASTDNVGVSGYHIDRDGVTIVRTASSSFVDSGLVTGRSYSYTATAYDAAGNQSGTSAPVSAVPGGGGDTQAPSTPAGLQPTATGLSTIGLIWQASNDNVGVAGYKIYRGGVQVAETSGTSFSDSGLSPGSTYAYRVAAYDAAGNTSAQSSEILAATSPLPDTQPPSPPANLKVTDGKGRKIVLDWDAATDNVGVTSYRVFRDGALIATVLDRLSYSDSPRRGHHAYYVVAVDAAGNQSQQSNSVIAAA